MKSETIAKSQRRAAEILRRALAQHSPLFILAGLCLVLAVISPEFRQAKNLQQVGLRTCVVAIMAVGQILVILTAGIDLSYGRGEHLRKERTRR